MNYRHLPDVFSMTACEQWLSQAARRLQRHHLQSYYKCESVKQSGNCGLTPACLGRKTREERHMPSRLRAFPCEREKTETNVGSARRRRDATVRAVRQSPPKGRRGIARNGDRAAIDRRSEIDRSGGLGKPRGGPCHEGDHVATSAATPATGRHAGTRSLVTDAAPGRGSHPTCVGSRHGSGTMRPAASRRRSRATRPRITRSPCLPCSMREASGVSPRPRGGRSRPL